MKRLLALALGLALSASTAWGGIVQIAGLRMYALSDTTAKNGVELSSLTDPRHSSGTSAGNGSYITAGSYSIAAWDTVVSEAIGANGSLTFGVHLTAADTAGFGTPSIIAVVGQMSENGTTWADVATSVGTTGMVIAASGGTGSMAQPGTVWTWLAGTSATAPRGLTYWKYWRIKAFPRATVTGFNARAVTQFP